MPEANLRGGQDFRKGHLNAWFGVIIKNSLIMEITGVPQKMDHITTVRLPDKQILKNIRVIESSQNEEENETICDLL